MKKFVKFNGGWWELIKEVIYRNPNKKEYTILNCCGGMWFLNSLEGLEVVEVNSRNDLDD